LNGEISASNHPKVKFIASFERDAMGDAAMDGPKAAGREEKSDILISKVRGLALILRRAKIRFNLER